MRFSERIVLALVLAGWLVGCGEPDAIRLAEELRDPDAPQLRQALQGGSFEQRLAAVVALGRIQEPGQAAPLAGVVRGDGPAALREAALFALGQLGLAVGARVPQVAVDACVEALGDPSPVLRVAALQALGKLTPPDLPRLVLPWLEDPDPAIRAEAALALFRYRFVPVWREPGTPPPELPDAAVAALTGRLDDADPEVRWSAAYVFSRFPDPRPAERLAGALGDDNEWVRLFSLRSIGLSGQTALIPRLLPALRDSSYRVRVEAVAALAALGGADRLPDELLEDPVFHVRAAVARALAQAAPGDAARLARLLDDRSATVRGAAIEALGARREVRTSERLAGYLTDADWRIRLAALRGLSALELPPLPALRGALDDRDTRVRCAALSAVAETDSAAVVAALADEDLALRGTAVELISEGQSPQKQEWLSSAYDASSGEEWIELRETIVQGLAGLDTAQPLLRRIAQSDPAGSVRAVALRALRAQGVELDVAPPRRRPSPLLDVRFESDPTVVLQTTQGPIAIRCLARQAPLHVAHFVDLVRRGAYDGLEWHRVVGNFVIQGGDPRGDGWGGHGFTLRDEIHPVRYRRGSVGMPKAGKDTGGGQLFITHLPTPHLDGNYTIFGEVQDGLDVVDRIEVGDRILSSSLR